MVKDSHREWFRPSYIVDESKGIQRNGSEWFNCRRGPEEIGSDWLKLEYSSKDQVKPSQSSKDPKEMIQLVQYSVFMDYFRITQQTLGWYK